jgi:hypothetical protein
MSMRIRSGSGTSYEAKVTQDQRLSTRASTSHRFLIASEEDSLSYIVATGSFISISTINTEYGILYFKNTSTDEHFHIKEIRTCGTNLTQWKYYKNSTTGTLISGAVAGIATNIDFKSPRTIEGIVYKGANGVTLTDGTLFDQMICETGHCEEHFEGALILGPGNSIAMTVQVPVAASVCCRIMGWYELEGHD